MTIRNWYKENSKKYSKEELSKQHDRFQKETGSTANFETYKRNLRKAYEKGKRGKPSKNTTLSEESDEDYVSVEEETDENGIYQAVMTSSWVKTPEQLIDYLKIDESKWVLTKFTKGFWGSTANPNHQVKGIFSPRNKDSVSEKEILAIIKEKVETFKPSFTKSKVILENDTLLEIAIEDQHFGQLSVKSNSGEDYNITIAHDLYIEATDYFLEMGKIFKPSKIVFLVGSDYFNVDGPANTTYSGTPQDEVSLWKDTFSKGLDTCIEAIEKCYDCVPNVEVKIVQGNHDYTRAWYLGIALEQRYRDCEGIKIDVSESIRKYVSWGNSLICLSHGNIEAMSKLPFIIAKEQPEACCKAKYIEAHCGHLHIEKESLVLADEGILMKVRILPSLVADSAWAQKKGLYHIRESQAFIWDKTQGNIAMLKHHLD